MRLLQPTVVRFKQTKAFAALQADFEEEIVALYITGRREQSFHEAAGLTPGGNGGKGGFGMRRVSTVAVA